MRRLRSAPASASPSQAYDLDDAALREASGVASRKNAETEDYKEGPRAFIEKRAPRWAGR